MITESASAAITDPAQKMSKRYSRRKEAILDVAAALINRRGLGELTLAVVASEIGLNLKSLRYYFAQREDLVAATFGRSIALHRALVAEAACEATLEARVKRLVRGNFDLYARVRRGDEPEFVLFDELRALAEPQSIEIYQNYNQFFREVRSLLGSPDDPARRKDLNAKTHMLISQIFWAVTWIRNYDDDSLARAAERFSDNLLTGIALEPVDLQRAIGTSPIATPGSERLSQESFLRATTALINEHGYRGASVERISTKLGVTKGAFYHHNETRQALIAACFERTFDVVRQAQNLAMTSDLPGAARVSAIAVGLATWQMIDEGLMLRTSALTAVGPDLRDEMTRRMSLLTGRFVDMLNDGLVDGSVRVCDIRIAAEMVTATINSAAELRRWVPGIEAGDVAHLYVRPLLFGLMTPASTAT